MASNLHRLELHTLAVLLAPDGSLMVGLVKVAQNTMCQSYMRE